MTAKRVLALLLLGVICISACNTKGDTKKEVKRNDPEPSKQITSKYNQIDKVLKPEGYNDYISKIVNGTDSIFNHVDKNPYSSTDQYKRKRLRKVREYVSENIVKRFLLFYESEPEYHSYDPDKEILSLQKKIYSPSIDLMYYDEREQKYGYTIGSNMSNSRINYLTKSYDEIHEIEQFSRETARNYDILNRKLGVYILMESRANEDMKEGETYVNLNEDGELEYPIYTDNNKWNVKDTSLVLKYIDLKVISTEISDGGNRIIKINH